MFNETKLFQMKLYY